MVAVVAGNGLGLGDTSALLLGGRGTVGDARVGRGTDRVFLNAATGNLIIQSRDELLLGRGLDVIAHRAYNSLGQFDYGNNDNWLSGLNKRIYGLTGTVNTAGSTVIRADWDGTETVYTYNTTTARYETKAGDGAHDFLALSGSTWTWTNGDTRATESYDNASSGRITAQRDPSGNQITYTYNTSGQLTRVQSPVTVGATNTTESVYLDYTGTLLTQVRTVYKNASNGDVPRTRVRYEYDTSSRLSRVRVDLSPDDNSIATGTTYDTTYTYDGTSTRVASIAQTDGSRLDFVYTLVGSTYRVTRITQTAASGVLRITNVAYDTVNRTTTLTDPLNYATVFGYDTANRLTRITAPAVGGVTQTVQFGYDADSNVRSVTDAKGNVVTYEYNAQGLMTLQRDQAGNTVTRTYNANNQLDSETVYFTPDPDGAGTGLPGTPAVTRYLYDSVHRLRYVRSSEGRITEYRYNAQGLRTSAHEYTSDLHTGTTYTEAALNTWRDGLLDKSRVMRTDYTYDYRGALASETRSSRVRADGVASLDSAAAEYTSVRYVYDSFGNLLQRLPTVGSSAAEVYAYDGLGRVLSSTDLNNALTVTTYDDVNTQTRTTFADGLIRTQVFNKAGELISLLEGQGATTLSTTQYRYDALGRLRYVQDPTGVRTHILYDAASRKIAEIDADGSLTEFFYDANNLVTRTLRYANKLSSAALAGLVDGSGNPINVALAAAGSAVTTTSIPRPAASSSSDRNGWRLYDAANRLHKEVDARGAVVEYFYDGASRLVKTTAWANFINVTTFAATPTSANATPTASATADRTTRYFYDNDGKLRGTLDGEGFIVEHRYSAAGQKIQTWRYADAAASADRAAGALATLIANRGTANRASDITEHYLYDGRGLLRSHFDGEGNRTEYAYDQYGNVRSMNRGRKIDTSLLTTPQSVTIQFQARATVAGSVWPTVQVRVDGVVVGTVTIGSATNTTYTVTATSVVPVGNHTVDFVYTNDDGIAGSTTTSRTVWISNGALKVGSYTQALPSGSTSLIRDSGSGAAAFDDSIVTELDRTAEQVLDLNASLRYVTSPWSNEDWTVATMADELTTFSYNAYGQLLSKTVALGGGITETDTYTYDLRRRLTGQMSSVGTVNERSTRVLYDVQGRTTATLSGHGSELFAAVSAARIASQVDAVIGQWGTRYAYDSAGRRISSIDAKGNRTYFYYDSEGRLTYEIRQSSDSSGKTYGEVVQTVYNSFNEIGESITYANRLSASTFNSLNGGFADNVLTTAVASIADGLRDGRTSYVYNTTGTLQASRVYTSSTAFDATTISYNAFREETSRTSPTIASDTVVTGTGYDRRGLTTSSVVDAAGLSIASSTTFDAFGRVVRSTDARGIQRSGTYDRAGRVIFSTDGNGQTESLAYDAVGRVLTRTDRRGQVTTFAYSPFARQITVRTPEGVSTVSSYNPYGQITRVQILGGAAASDTVYLYDSDGRLQTTTRAQGSLNLSTSNRYDRVGNLAEVVDARGVVTRYSYDAANRILARTVDPGGLSLVTRYAYDGRGQSVTVTDANGTTTVTTFDKKGQRVEVQVDPAGLNLRTRFSYDRRGNTVAVTEGYGSTAARTTNYAFDKAGRLASTVVDPGLGRLNLTTTYAYDKNGNLSTKTDARGSVTRHAYDGENRLRFTLDATNAISETVYDAAGLVTQVVRYASFQSVSGATSVITTTTAGGNVTHTINQSNVVKDAGHDRATSYVYDRDGRKIYERDALGSVTGFKYDVAGNVIERTDFANRISVSAAVVVGGFASATVVPDSALDRTTRYVYDSANRLVYTLDSLTLQGASGGQVSERVYDANGNLARLIYYATPLTIAGNPEAATVAARLPALTDNTDPARANARETIYTYDNANRAVHELTSWSFEATRNFVAREFQYDGLGRIVKRIQYETAIAAADLSTLAAGATGTIGDDVIQGSELADTVYALAGNDVVRGAGGSDYLQGGDGNDVIEGSRGADYLTGDSGADVLRGGSEGDNLYGGNDNDLLEGGSGADYLSGDAGNDVLDGGVGNDNLSGGSGADTYVFNRGSGQDSINNYDSDAVAINPDTILMGPDIAPGDVIVYRSYDDLVIALKGTNDRVTVSQYFNTDASSPYAVDTIKFADGTTWTIAQVKVTVLATGAGNDTVYGYATNDTLDAGDGNDYLYGRAGTDVLSGGAGSDTIYGEDGSDTLRGGTQNDSLSGGAGNDTLQGNEHNDTLYGDAGNDSLDGGTGSDYLTGGDGADVYLFGRGSGSDSISNYDAEALGVNADTIQLGSGIATTDVTLTRTGDNLLLNINGTDDWLTVQNYFNTDGTTSYTVENLRFADTTVWNVATVKAKVLIGGPNNDSLYGYASADSLSGGDGNDTLYGKAGNDTLDGGAGNDSLSGEDGDDVVRGGTQNDSLSGGAGNDTLQGNEHNDTLYGDAGNDSLDGGTGSDYLTGGDGADVYLFGRGSGSDSISNYDAEALGVNADTIQLGSGIATTDVTLTRTGDNLLLNINGTDDWLTVQNYFNTDGTTSYTVENLRFADTTVWNVATVKAKVLIGGPNNDSLYGYASADSLSGGDGNDTLYGKAGNDTLDGGAGNDSLSGEDGDDVVRGGTQNDSLSGGAGNDTLQGNEHNDTLYGDAGNDSLDGGTGSDYLTGGDGADVYLFGRGSGSDSISNYDAEALGVNADTIQLGSGIATTDVTLTRTGDNLLLNINGTDDWLTVAELLQHRWHHQLHRREPEVCRHHRMERGHRQGQGADRRTEQRQPVWLRECRQPERRRWQRHAVWQGRQRHARWWCGQRQSER